MRLSLFAALLVYAPAIVAQRPPGPLVAAVPGAPMKPPARFTFQSNAWINLHHFLYLTARGRAGIDTARATVRRALGDTVGYGALDAAARQEWEAALAYYRRAWADRDILFDSVMVRAKDQLTAFGEAPTLGGGDLDSTLAHALNRAMPVYRRVWWARHDMANRAWIAAMAPLLAQWGDAIAEGEVRAFRTPWATTPVPVDVSAYANWASAYTTDHPAHIMMAAPDNAGFAGLEMLFHEVLHTMDDSLFVSLRAVFRERGMKVPANITHAMIFYTAGELTRRAIPAHVPFAEQAGLWRGNSLGAFFLLLQRYWQPFLEGRATFEEAIRRIAEGVAP